MYFRLSMFLGSLLFKNKRKSYNARICSTILIYSISIIILQANQPESSDYFTEVHYKICAMFHSFGRYYFSPADGKWAKKMRPVNFLEAKFLNFVFKLLKLIFLILVEFKQYGNWNANISVYLQLCVSWKGHLAKQAKSFPIAELNWKLTLGTILCLSTKIWIFWQKSEAIK